MGSDVGELAVAAFVTKIAAAEISRRPAMEAYRSRGDARGASGLGDDALSAPEALRRERWARAATSS